MFDVVTQIERATRGQAAGQCSGCWAYCPDGRPPLLHNDGCTEVETVALSADRIARAHRAAVETRRLVCGARVHVTGEDGTEALICRLDVHANGDHEAINGVGERVAWRDDSDPAETLRDWLASGRAPRPTPPPPPAEAGGETRRRISLRRHRRV